MRGRLLALVLAVSLLGLLSACSTVVNVGHDAAMGIHNTVVGEVELGAGLVQETLTNPSHATLWHWLLSPVDAAKVLVDSVHGALHGMGHHLHGH
ncbi:MAG: hypothetical protein Q7S12_00320 [bacterium]|nr:hypothetical protein [bacterium]